MKLGISRGFPYQFRTSSLGFPQLSPPQTPSDFAPSTVRRRSAGCVRWLPRSSPKAPAKGHSTSRCPQQMLVKKRNGENGWKWAITLTCINCGSFYLNNRSRMWMCMSYSTCTCCLWEWFQLHVGRWIQHVQQPAGLLPQYMLTTNTCNVDWPTPHLGDTWLLKTKSIPGYGSRIQTFKDGWCTHLTQVKGPIL